jgi:hypothetical protein
MTLDEYAKNLGGLIANLLSLEISLRGFLRNLPDAPPSGLPHGTDIYTCAVGTVLPETDFTNYSSLFSLIKKVNAELIRQKVSPQIDISLVDLRDALAHGRVSAPVEGNIMRLIKFSKPAKGYVEITVNEEMTADWFSEQRKRILEAMQIVAKVMPGGVTYTDS